jgi:hypothetical protein
MMVGKMGQIEGSYRDTIKQRMGCNRIKSLFLKWRRARYYLPHQVLEVRPRLWMAEPKAAQGVEVNLVSAVEKRGVGRVRGDAA